MSRRQAHGELGKQIVEGDGEGEVQPVDDFGGHARVSCCEAGAANGRTQMRPGDQRSRTERWHTRQQCSESVQVTANDGLIVASDISPYSDLSHVPRAGARPAFYCESGLLGSAGRFPSRMRETPQVAVEMERGQRMRMAIIGGGIAGLAAAYELEKARAAGAPVEYTLYEARARLGGSLASEIVDGAVLERGPDSFLTEKPAAAELCRELGLGGELIAFKRRGAQDLYCGAAIGWWRCRTG